MDITTITLPRGQPQITDVPKPLTSHEQLSVELGVVKPKVLIHIGDPEVIVFSDVFSSVECDVLVSLIQPRLTRSYVFENATGASIIDPGRSSKGAYFGRGENLLIDTLDQRLATLCNWPLEKTEQLQFLQYEKGEKYIPHYDFFHTDQPGSNETIKIAGNRVATIIVYLQEPVRGGSTFFPDLNLRVNPVKGSAVFFSYERPDADTKTLHSGEPVISGTKSIVTKWFREKKFQDI
jgi:prolyl 4-hydroxylase